MAKFNIGDKVVLKSSVVSNSIYNGVTVHIEIIENFLKTNYGIITEYDESDSTVKVNIGIDNEWWVGEDALELYQPSIPKYKVGDKVRIKKKEGYTSDYPLGFTEGMATLSGRIYTIQAITAITCLATAQKKKFFNNDVNKYQLNDGYGGFVWHSSMFELVEDSKYHVGDPLVLFIGGCSYTGTINKNYTTYRYFFLFDGEHFINCEKIKANNPWFIELAIEHGAIKESGGAFPEFNTIDGLVDFINFVNTKTEKFSLYDRITICKNVGTIERFTDSYYIIFPDHENVCHQLRVIFPDFDGLAVLYGAEKDCKPDCFPKFPSIANLVSFVNKVNMIYSGSTAISTIKNNDHEIRLQKSKASIHRGTVPEGHRVCGKGCKATIVVGHLSYRESYC